MRKRNITAVADTVYWYFIYLVPLFVFIAILISYIVACSGLAQAGGSWDIVGELYEIQGGLQEGTLNGSYQWETDGWSDAFRDGWFYLGDVVNSVTEGWMDAQMNSPIGLVVYDFNEFYVTGGYGQDVISSFLLCSMIWFINANIIHLAVDFLLFIPRLAHKWLKKGTQDD